MLVVEDELLIRWSIVETLSNAGWVVTEAGDAASALRAAETGPFNAIVLDYRLPDSNDLGLLAALKARLPKTAVIMMSAFGTPEVVQQARALGVIGFLDKPFEMEALRTLLVSDRV